MAPGIPDDERQWVFARFTHRSNTQASGSGLGLALVAQQAMVHGGRATIDTAPLGGIRVTVLLSPSATQMS